MVKTFAEKYHQWRCERLTNLALRKEEDGNYFDAAQRFKGAASHAKKLGDLRLELGLTIKASNNFEEHARQQENGAWLLREHIFKEPEPGDIFSGEEARKQRIKAFHRAAFHSSIEAYRLLRETKHPSFEQKLSNLNKMAERNMRSYCLI